MFDYQPLSAQYLSGKVLVSHPSQSKPITLESSALDVMTDLRHNNAVVIEPYVTMEFANSYMIQCCVRSLFVLLSWGCSSVMSLLRCLTTICLSHTDSITRAAHNDQIFCD